MAETGGFDEVLGNLDAYTVKLEAELLEVCGQIGEMLEFVAQNWHGNRPRKAARVRNPQTGQWFLRPAGVGWGNITGDTELTTHYRIRTAPQSILIILTTSTSYTKYLELAMNGNWAWLLQTILNHEEDIRRMLALVGITDVTVIAPSWDQVK